MSGLMPVLSPEDHAILSAWRLAPILSASFPVTGTVNRTILIQTEDGAYAFRAYSRRDRARVVWEHTAIAWAAAQGVPACLPLPLPNGESVLERDDYFFALFPFAAGRQIARSDLGMAEVAAAGRCLARIHLAFADFPLARARPKNLAINLASVLENIPRIEAAIRALPVQTDTEQAALGQLAARRSWLSENIQKAENMPERLTALPQAVVHGDFQETNLFFSDSEVSAVIDWDQSGVAASAWEVLRALHLMLGLSPISCRAFLAAYRDMNPLPEAGLEEVAACYGILADQNLWVYEAVYLEGNARARSFLTPDAFIPFVTRWREMVKDGNRERGQARPSA